MLYPINRTKNLLSSILYLSSKNVNTLKKKDNLKMTFEKDINTV